MSQHIAMKIYPQNLNAEMPSYGTNFAACFDLKACLKGVESVTVFNLDNEKIQVPVIEDAEGNVTFTLEPGMRSLVPTGLIFDLPAYFSMRIHPRSGLALKNGITLINAEGVIDPDYVDPTFITLFNLSNVPFVVKHLDRVAQGEIVDMSNRIISIHRLTTPPKRVGNRSGGFGSTGVAS